MPRLPVDALDGHDCRGLGARDGDDLGLEDEDAVVVVVVDGHLERWLGLVVGDLG